MVKNAAETKIKIQGAAGAPVTGVKLQGWSFDGRGGVDGLGGTLTATTDGGAFYLDHCEQCEPQLQNHQPPHQRRRRRPLRRQQRALYHRHPGSSQPRGQWRRRRPTATIPRSLSTIAAPPSVAAAPLTATTPCCACLTARPARAMAYLSTTTTTLRYPAIWVLAQHHPSGKNPLSSKTPIGSTGAAENWHRPAVMDCRHRP